MKKRYYYTGRHQDSFVFTDKPTLRMRLTTRYFRFRKWAHGVWEAIKGNDYTTYL